MLGALARGARRRMAKRAKSLIKRGPAGSALSQLTDQQRAELRSCFRAFDKDGSGFLCAAARGDRAATRAPPRPPAARRSPPRRRAAAARERPTPAACCSTHVCKPII